MRFLFVSSTVVGGSGRSQRELASRLVQLGHSVIVLADDDASAAWTRSSYERLSDLSVRLDGRWGHRQVRWFESRPGHATRSVEIDRIPHWISAVPQNALGDLIADVRPDILVGNSLERWAWRHVHETCRARGVPTVLYLREVESLPHLDTEAVPDAFVANSESLATAVRARGFACSFVPSVIEVGVTLTRSTRRVALAVNPIASRGVDIVWQIAERMPHVPFVVQESWPLDETELDSVNRRVESLPNVEFRRARTPGAELYADARVLLVPYRVDNRPRVIPEAQANAIPVIVADVPALVEAIGAGGVAVPLDSIGAWVDAIEVMWNDSTRYECLAEAAETHGRREDIDPALVAMSFVAVVDEVIAAIASGDSDANRPGG